MMSALGALIADYNVAQSAMLQMQKIIKTPSPQLYSMLSFLALLQVIMNSSLPVLLPPHELCLAIG